MTIVTGIRSHLDFYPHISQVFTDLILWQHNSDEHETLGQLCNNFFAIVRAVCFNFLVSLSVLHFEWDILYICFIYLAFFPIYIIYIAWEVVCLGRISPWGSVK